jgi:hypothetical protein
MGTFYATTERRRRRIPKILNKNETTQMGQQDMLECEMEELQRNLGLRDGEKRSEDDAEMIRLLRSDGYSGLPGGMSLAEVVLYRMNM